MAYFTPAFIQFLKDLSRNNNREWFHEHKKTYENEVKKPFYQLVQDIINEMKMEDPELNLEVKNAVFRINRDIRFSKDKSPYKTYVSAAISRGGRKDMQFPGIYVHLEPENFMVAGGCYMPDKENLTKLRRYIVDHPEEVRKALSDKVFIKTYGGLTEGENNKILPKEFKPFGEDHPLIFNKQYYYHRSIEDDNVFLREDLLKVIMDHFKAGKPWNEIIKKAIYG
jgi:uncharacterized protein (TIGR02453 family)